MPEKVLVSLSISSPTGGQVDHYKQTTNESFMIKYRIAIAARKGGVGKSSIACGLASVLSKDSYRTLVVDLDPQSNAAYVLGVDPTAPGTADVLNRSNVEPESVNPMLHVFPGGLDLMGASIQKLHPEELADITAELDYDAVIFDCPPGNENLERLGTTASDIALVVCNAHPLAVIGAGRVLMDLKENHARHRRGPSKWSFVQSQIDQRRSLDRELTEQLKSAYPGIPLQIVRQDTNLALAAADRIPIMDYAPNSKAADDLKEIVRWIINA